MAAPAHERRLAAILSADMAGFSRLMEIDDEGVIARQKDHRRELIDPQVSQHQGRIVKTTGDGVLVEFPSAVAAVRCAIAVQETMAGREMDVPRDRRIAYRVGVNLGDVVVDGDDIYGDGVNVATRLQELADPGGVCISSLVWESLGNRVSLNFRYDGERHIKNISRPIHVWRWAAGSNEERVFPAAAPPPPGKREIPSIAVLPFENMSGDPDHEYFSDGLSEDLITALSKFRWLYVIARNSAFVYKGEKVDISRIAAELGVRYVLEGSVRRAGKRVRVSAQLIDAARNSHLWAERYDRPLKDVFALQDEITATIVGALEPELSGAERARARSKPPGDLDAWERYQRGMWHFWRTTPEENVRARELFLSAIEQDEDFGPAYAGLAYVGFTDVIFGFTDRPAETLEDALRAGLKAVALDDRDAMARLALGRIYTMQGRHDEAVDHLETAIRLNPSFALGHSALGHALHWAGRPGDALPHFDRALRLSPHDPMAWAITMMKGAAYFMLGDDDNAVAWATRAVRLDDAKYLTHVQLAAALAAAGRADEARGAMTAARERNPELNEVLVRRILQHQDEDYVERFVAALKTAGLP